MLISALTDVISTGRTAIFLNINPIAGVVGSVIILHESFTLIQAVGGIIILISLFLVNRKANEQTGAPV